MITIRVSYATEDELDRKLRIIMERRGYRVEKASVEPITVGQLAREVGRHARSVSRSLHRPSCPPFEARRGKRRIIKLTPNPGLLLYLTQHE